MFTRFQDVTTVLLIVLAVVAFLPALAYYFARGVVRRAGMTPLARAIENGEGRKERTILEALRRRPAVQVARVASERSGLSRASSPQLRLSR